MKENKKRINPRYIIQGMMLFTVIIAALNLSIPWVHESIFHYICPTCGITSIYQFFISQTSWVVKLKSSLGIVIGISIILSVLFGPVICGFICPFGTIQDIFAVIGKKMFKNKYNSFVSKKVEEQLKYLRYIMLALTISLTVSGGITILEAVNPYHAFLGIFNKKLSLIGFAILIIIITLSLFIQRPWCKYLCPYGAFLGLFNKIKVFRIVKDDKNCIGCKRCNKTCPMNIEITKTQEVRELRCISCLECVNTNVCLKESTIKCTSKDVEGTVSYEK